MSTMKKPLDKSSFLQADLLLPHIRKKLAKIDWRSPRAPILARELITGLLDQYLSHTIELAREADVSHECFLRNQIATSGKKDVGFFLLPVKYMAKKGEKILGPGQHHILRKFPDWATPDVELALLDEERQITGEMIKCIAPGQRVARFQLAVQDACDLYQDKPRQILPHVISEAQTIFRADTKPCTMKKVAKAIEGHRIHGLSLARFHYLPSMCKKELLGSVDLLRAILHPRAAAILEPVVHQAKRLGFGDDVPLLDEVVSKITPGRLKFEKTQKLIQVWGLKWPQTRQAIKKLKFDPDQNTAGIIRIPLQDSIETMALHLHLMTEQKLEKAVLRMTRDDLGKILGKVHLESFLEVLISGSRKEQTLDALMRAGLKRSEIIKTFVSRAKKSSQFDLLWLQHLSSRGLLNLAALRRLNEVIALRLRRKNREHYVNRLLNPEWLKLIFTNEDSLNPFRLGFLDELRKYPAVWSQSYAHLLDVLGEWLIDYSRPSLKKHELNAILAGEHSAYFFERLSDASYYSECPAWRRYLNNLAREKLPVPRHIQSALRQHTVLLKKAFRQHPYLFARLTLDKLPLRDLLPHAFQSREFGRRLDKQTTPSMRLEHLGWLQSEHQVPQRKKAAHALALLVGTRFAPYLSMLAQRLPLEKIGSTKRWLLILCALPVLAFLAYQTNQQIPVWKSPLSLWQHAVETSPDSRLAQFNLGVANINDGDYEAAAHQFENAGRLERKPGKALAWHALTFLYLDRHQSALAAHTELLSISGSRAELAADQNCIQYNIGWISAHLGEHENAEKFFRKVEIQSKLGSWASLWLDWLDTKSVSVSETTFDGALPDFCDALLPAMIVVKPSDFSPVRG